MEYTSGELIQALPIKQDFPGYYEELNDIAISPNGDVIVSVSRERMVTIWTSFMTYLKLIGI